ncbi:hypothetical protein GGR16_003241 [Chelatococcus caeni]|uniref:Host nuclease inhibitor protein n=1 Tax=Chelatococcus caeni TaxID=1348468 RepID=A0A840C771_9HYPH|nr:host nuclease inhibitor protein [Chelatococcus caeni]MBB4018207.1 hypothetical protein [Chelatococcus caeni]
MARSFYAYAWRTGVIEFGPRIPEGALPVDRGGEQSVRRRVSIAARHAYDGKTLLVPGIPEATTDVQAYEAWKSFKEQIARRRAGEPAYGPIGG